MGTHDCGCKTRWDDELNHPVYEKACGVHKGWAATWMAAEAPNHPLLHQPVGAGYASVGLDLRKAT